MESTLNFTLKTDNKQMNKSIAQEGINISDCICAPKFMTEIIPWGWGEKEREEKQKWNFW